MFGNFFCEKCVFFPLFCCFWVENSVFLCFSMCVGSFFTGCLGVVLYLQSQKNVKKGGPINVASRPFVGGAVFCVLSHIFIKTQHPAVYIFLRGVVKALYHCCACCSIFCISTTFSHPSSVRSHCSSTALCVKPALVNSFMLSLCHCGM